MDQRRANSSTEAVPCQSLQLYRRDVDRLPSLPDAAIQALLTQVIGARNGHISSIDGRAARNTLLNGLLHLVLPITLRYVALPGIDILDLIQEGNLSLLNAIEACPEAVLREGTFIPYACSCIQNSISVVLEASLPIRIPRSSLWKARKQGTADELRDLQLVISLDKPLDNQSTTSLADLLVAADGTQAGNEPNWQQLALRLLERLPDLERRALQLRCGLDENDQRRCSYTEIARTLDVSISTAYDAVHRGVQMLLGQRELPQERAARQEKARRARTEMRRKATHEQVQAGKPQWKSQREQIRQQRLDVAFRQLIQQGSHVTTDRLATLAGVRTAHATKYLRQIRSKLEVGA